MRRYLLQIGSVAGLGWLLGGMIDHWTMDTSDNDQVNPVPTRVSSSVSAKLSKAPNPSQHGSSVKLSKEDSISPFPKNPERFKYCSKNVAAYDPVHSELQIGSFLPGTLLEIGCVVDATYAYARYHKPSGEEVVALVFLNDVGGAVP